MELFRPTSQAEVAKRLRECHDVGAAFPQMDRSGLKHLVEYTPEDMTATVEAGMTLGEFRAVLQAHNQWLPIDLADANLSIGEILDRNLFGPRRYGYGTIRDYLIGIRVALPSGEIIRAGGKVVKNVAGYDLCKLFIGARQTLGVIVEGTFKVLPKPEAAAFLMFETTELRRVQERFEMILASNLRPVVLDARRREVAGPLQMLAGFEGTTEEVEVQARTLQGHGFVEQPQDSVALSGKFSAMESVLPSRCCEYLGQLKGEWHAHLGNGIILHNEELSLARQKATAFLAARLKQTFDPRNILPQFPA